MPSFDRLAQVLLRFAAIALAAGLLGACEQPVRRAPILASAPATGLLAVSAVGSTNVRILHVSGGSIVLVRMVFMPAGEQVESVTWSSDEREAMVGTTRGGVLALDTRTWRLAPYPRLAAVARHDARLDGRR
jgi:hypothetical protein